MQLIKFKPQNTRSASTSEASLCPVPLDQIMSAAGWTLASTFDRFYNKPIDVNDGFTDGNLLLDQLPNKSFCIWLNWFHVCS